MVALDRESRPKDKSEVKDQNKRLTAHDVDCIISSFLAHIAHNWETYKHNLPALRRTMMFYNEFAYGIRSLPENNGCSIEFNPKDPLLDDLRAHFGERFTEEIADLIYDAWPLRAVTRPWDGYEEPLDNTPEALMEAYPDLFKTREAALDHMHNYPGTGFATIDGERVKVGSSGIPEIRYKGFTTVREFPEQKAFLDTIRNNPRIQRGIELMNVDHERSRLEKEEQEANLSKRLASIVKDLDPGDTSSEEDPNEIVKKISDLLKSAR